MSQLLRPHWEIICIEFYNPVSSSNFLIQSFQMSDAFCKSSFFLNFLMLLYDDDQLIQLLMRCNSVCISSVLFLCNNENLLCAALKTRKIYWLLQNLGKLFGCWSHDKCIAMHLKSWSEQFTCLCAPMCTPIWLSHFSYWLAVYLKVVMLKCLHFSHTTGSLYYDGWMTLHLGRC